MHAPPHPAPSEDALHAALQAGQHDAAIGIAWQLYHRTIEDVLDLYEADESEREDALLAVFGRALRWIHAYQPGNFRGWLTQIARYEAQAHRKERAADRRRRALNVEACDGAVAGSAEDLILAAQLFDALKLARESMDPVTAAIFDGLDDPDADEDRLVEDITGRLATPMTRAGLRDRRLRLRRRLAGELRARGFVP